MEEIMQLLSELKNLQTEEEKTAFIFKIDREYPKIASEKCNYCFMYGDVMTGQNFCIPKETASLCLGCIEDVLNYAKNHLDFLKNDENYEEELF